MAVKKLSDIAKAMLETADGMHRAGIMDEATYRKITIRHLGPDAPPPAAPISAEEIRREGIDALL